MYFFGMRLVFFYGIIDDAFINNLYVFIAESWGKLHSLGEHSVKTVLILDTKATSEMPRAALTSKEPAMNLEVPVTQPLSGSVIRCKDTQNTGKSCRAGPWIVSFLSMLFHWKKKLILRCVEFARSPHVCMDFLWGLQFPPPSQSCVCEVNGYIFLKCRHSSHWFQYLILEVCWIFI